MTDRRQRQKAQEQAKREAARKAASRREMFRRIGIALGLGLLVVAFLLVQNLLGGGEPEQPEGYRAFLDQPVACDAEPAAEQTTDRFEEPDDQSLDGPVSVVVDTSCGSFTVILDPAQAPTSVNDFVFLVEQGAYDGTVFHLVSSEIWIQGGDPTGGAGGSFFQRYRTPNEPAGDGFEMVRGTVGLVGDAASRGSAFFVVTGEDTPLSSRVNVIGEVADGMEVIDRISEVPTRGTRPTETVFIESATLAEG